MPEEVSLDRSRMRFLGRRFVAGILSLGNGFFSKEEENMESEDNLEPYGEMSICAVCGEVFGRIRYSGEPRVFYQPCPCSWIADELTIKNDLVEYLNLDFSQAVTLCYGCGRELIRSGSKWSPFFCEYCLGYIRGSNVTDPSFPGWIPVGRHSMMNGLALGGPDAQDKEKVEQFCKAVNSLQERIEHLERWKKLVVSRIREEAGFPKEGDIQLTDYLEAVPRDKWSKFMTLRPLWSFFTDKFCPPSDEEVNVPSVTEPAGQLLDEEVEDDRIQYTSEKEIRCVFYALVVRNQALEKKYTGGLTGFLKRHGGEYNDEILTICYMAPEFDSDVADLKANGLELDKDFLLLIDDLYGPPSSYKDFEPYPFEVSWLGGYYHEGGVVVFMVS
jgi:hypothetical protein